MVSALLVSGGCRKEATKPRSARETEKPKVSGCCAKRRLSIVDLPEPEGPDITIGRWICDAFIWH